MKAFVYLGRKASAAFAVVLTAKAPHTAGEPRVTPAGMRKVTLPAGRHQVQSGAR
jgi:hypothetical protein